MSGLTKRISELEQQLGRCPDCSRATIELVYAGAPKAAKPRNDRCRTCGEPLDQITVLLAFDPQVGSAGGPAHREQGALPSGERWPGCVHTSTHSCRPCRRSRKPRSPMTFAGAESSSRSRSPPTDWC